MLVPRLPTGSWALKAKRPKPDPIAGVSGNVPFQLLPPPESGTTTPPPTGGVKLKDGAGLAMTSLVVVTLTATLVLLTVCTGVTGAVVMLAAGGTVSMTRGTPVGAPLKTLPTWS